MSPSAFCPHSLPSLRPNPTDSLLVPYASHLYQPHQPFRRDSNCRIPCRGKVDRLPAMASLLRRQSMNFISCVPDPVLTLYAPNLKRTFNAWTHPHQGESHWATTLPHVEWMPLPPIIALPPDSRLRTSHKPLDHVLKGKVDDRKSVSLLRKDSRPKTSRYLREIDRRNILLRIDLGEKQSALAKEYHVSRAAICNLNKHRMDVLSRNFEHPMAKHPKRRKSAAIKKQHNIINGTKELSNR